MWQDLLKKNYLGIFIWPETFYKFLLMIFSVYCQNQYPLEEENLFLIVIFKQNFSFNKAINLFLASFLLRLFI